MLIKSGYRNILLNIDPGDVTSIHMDEIYPYKGKAFSIMIHRRSDDEGEPGIEVGRYWSEEIAQKNYDGLIKFFQAKLGINTKQSEIFYMSPND